MINLGVNMWKGIMLSLVGVLSCGTSYAAPPDLDLRSNRTVSSQTTDASYTLSVSDCSQLARLEYTHEGESHLLVAADASPNTQSSLGCQFSLELSDANYLNPSVSVYLVDGTSFDYSESFSFEQQKPEVGFDDVTVSTTNDEQFLITSVYASDDTDISYLGFSISAIRASVLRSVGGIVEKAKESAFAKTEGVQRVYPVNDTQNVFSLPLPLDIILTDSEVARDVIVLVDVYAVDASGNYSSFSKIAFAGDSIEEDELGLTAVPGNIIFSNALETASIIPTVEFEFRGSVPLSGLGTGVTYTSSDPDKVAVTPGGIVYPLSETFDSNNDPLSVVISVSYRDLTPVDIPVIVDYDKVISSLSAVGLSSGESLALPALNTEVPFPDFKAVFSDSSEAEIGQQLPLQVIVPDAHKDIIVIDGEQKTIKSLAVIPDSAPIFIEVRLTDLPDISIQLPITARDAEPEVELDVPAGATVDEVLVVKAQASDDVSVEAVRFYLNGSLLGERVSTPYEISLPINEAMAGQLLVMYAEAIDSVGQKTLSQTQSVTVLREFKQAIPSYEFEYPINNQRFVEVE